MPDPNPIYKLITGQDHPLSLGIRGPMPGVDMPPEGLQSYPFRSGSEFPLPMRPSMVQRLPITLEGQPPSIYNFPFGYDKVPHSGGIGNPAGWRAPPALHPPTAPQLTESVPLPGVSVPAGAAAEAGSLLSRGGAMLGRAAGAAGAAGLGLRMREIYQDKLASDRENEWRTNRQLELIQQYGLGRDADAVNRAWHQARQDWLDKQQMERVLSTPAPAPLYPMPPRDSGSYGAPPTRWYSNPQLPNAGSYAPRPSYLP